MIAIVIETANDHSNKKVIFGSNRLLKAPTKKIVYQIKKIIKLLQEEYELFKYAMYDVFEDSQPDIDEFIERMPEGLYDYLDNCSDGEILKVKMIEINE